MNQRIRKIRGRLSELGLDGIILSHPSNITYLTGYLSRDSHLLITKKNNIYFTDCRYTEEAKIKLQGEASVVKTDGRLFSLIKDACSNLKLKKLGIEEKHITFSEYLRLKKELNSYTRLIPLGGLVEELRQVKDAEEISKIRTACRIARESLRFIESLLVPGIKELEVVAELEHFIRYHGASDNAFDIIVASGPNSSFPHHLSADRKLMNNQPVLIDIGVDYRGYKSDLTRIFFLGKINVSVRRIYDIVRIAQEKAIKSIAPGKRICDIDAASRKFIAAKGFSAYFGHNLGHGVGLNIHEEPNISPKNEKILKPGMVFTVEPAIYLPKKFGIRIEDMVLVTRKGSEVLSGSLNK